MLLKWLDSREATELGTALADDFVLQTGPASADRGLKAAKPEAKGKDLQRFMQKFLQRVDRDARPVDLNLFKRAKLANSFKWRLLEKGIERQIVDELTQALVLRLTAKQGGQLLTSEVRGAAGRRTAAASVEGLLARGNECMTRGAHDEAINLYQEMLGIEPRHAVGRNNLGAALTKVGRYKEAEEEFRRAIGIRESYPDAHNNLGSVLAWRGQYEESEMPLRRALKLRPSYLDALINLGTTLYLLGRWDDAKDCFDRALRLAPRNVHAIVGLAQIAAPAGRIEEAETLLRRALDIEPKAPNAWAGLVGLRKMTLEDRSWLKSAEEIAASGLTPIEEATLRYAIGKFCDDVGDFSRAFHSYRRANELHKLRGDPYDQEAHGRFVQDLVRVYTPETLAAARIAGSDSQRPVFVVGMPRSGTSLVEQIIASHPEAKGAGELRFWSAAVRKHEMVLRSSLLDEPIRKRLAAAYLRVLEQHSPDARRVVDKLPANSDYLGTIHTVFPKARMIYLRRDPVDTCLSCYFQQFSPALSFATDLSDLANYFRTHHRLVEHWRTVLPPGTLLDVPYADLIADQEGWTRRIIDFLGLEWDARCLDFQTTARTVATASYWQVRQKMYTSSLGRWRNYQKFIGPLLCLRDLNS
jgi:tetratricopeptide (TPR) repeat protein